MLWKAGCGKEACPLALMELDGQQWCGKQTFLHFLLELHTKLREGVYETTARICFIKFMNMVLHLLKSKAFINC